MRSRVARKKIKERISDVVEQEIGVRHFLWDQTQMGNWEIKN